MRRSLVAALAFAGAALAMSLPSSAAPMSRLSDGANAAESGGIVQQVWHGHRRHCRRVCHGHLHWRYGYAHCHGHWEWRCHHHHRRHHHW